MISHLEYLEDDSEKTRTNLNFTIRLFICLLPDVFPIPSLQEGLYSVLSPKNLRRNLEHSKCSVNVGCLV